MSSRVLSVTAAANIIFNFRARDRFPPKQLATGSVRMDDYLSGLCKKSVASLTIARKLKHATGKKVGVIWCVSVALVEYS